MPIHHHDHNESSIHTPPAKQNSILVSLILKPIIMLFILSIFLFIGIFAVSTIFFLLAVSSLHLCRLRRYHHRRRCSTHTISTIELQQHLPRFLYEMSVESNKECAVCLESFETGEWCRRLAGCKHVFHVSCVDSWLAKVLNCPVCRAPVRFNPRASLSCGISSHKQSDDEFKLLWAAV
ncbi:hypothetical protein AgCh_009959 [Apium graveolens]